MDTGRPDTRTLENLGLITLLALGLAACSNDSGNSVTTVSDNEFTKPPSLEYLVLDEELQPFLDDFNRHPGKVRMVFISGPTCAICLRGLADLQTELMSKISGDPRYEVFVIHVPTLGAEEEHVIQSLPLLHGPNVHHYWDGPATSGLRYQETMDVNFYVWDYWAVYGPDTTWDGYAAPMPDYWEHQLGPWPRNLYLDPERFTQYIVDLGNTLELDNSLLAVGETPLGDGVQLTTIFQGLSVAIPTYHNGRGGYQALKTIVRIEWEGEFSTPDGNILPLKLSRDRKSGYKRTIGDSVASVNGTTLQLPETPRGLPAWAEKLLLEAYEFDSPITDWKDKGHRVEMAGMETLANELNWMLTVDQANGFHWKLLIDTHEGDINSAQLLDDAGNILLEIRELAHEEFDDWRFATRIQYRDGKGNILGEENITVKSITLDKQNAMASADVVH